MKRQQLIKVPIFRLKRQENSFPKKRDRLFDFVEAWTFWYSYFSLLIACCFFRVGYDGFGSE
jgi:hypothetical protein